MRQADEVALNDLFKVLKDAQTDAERQSAIDAIDSFETHVVPIIADIDAGFLEDTGRARVIEDCIASLRDGGADMLWIETDTPNVDEISGMVSEIRKEVPDAKLTYNNSPSFNWTLNLRNQVREQWVAEGRIKTGDYPNGNELMKPDYDDTELGHEADTRLQRFQTVISGTRRRVSQPDHPADLPPDGEVCR